jgi:GTP pyrophosphokinase
MIRAHRGQKRLNGQPYFRHPLAVTSEATKFGERVLRQSDGIILPMDLVTLREMWHAAMLHDVMEDAGFTFDDVLAITNLQIAQYVSALSHDNRLPRPRRIMEYANRLELADTPVQIIKLADLCCNLQEAVTLVRDLPSTAKESLVGWPEEVHECLAAIHVLGAGKLRRQWHWCADTVKSLVAIFKRWVYRERILGEIRAYPS